MSEKVKKPFYKKWWVWLLAVIIIIAVAGGGEEDTPEVTAPASAEAETTTGTEETEAPEEAPEETPEEVEETPEPAVQGMGEEVTVGEVTFTAHNTETASNVGGDYGQDAKGTFLIVEVSVRNDSSESITTDSSFFKLKANGKTYEADSMASVYANESGKFIFESINPDLTLTGYVVFDVSDAVLEAEDLLLNVQTGFWGTEQGEISLN